MQGSLIFIRRCQMQSYWHISRAIVPSMHLLRQLDILVVHTSNFIYINETQSLAQPGSY